MKILITGSNGLLGQQLIKHCLENSIDFVATSKGENRNPDCPQSNYIPLDITYEQWVQSVFNETKPTHVIHTAAITNVDQCELEPELCHNVNVEGTRNLIEASANQKAHFQLLSTDFVFDGEKGNYSEKDEINPLSVYAESKATAEEFTQQYEYNWSIVRTIIVYGIGNNLSRSNLIIWAKGALEEGTTINIIDDQFRAPTYADDLAKGCIEILLRHEIGIFHLCGPETMSIYEIVQRIAVHYGYSMQNVHKISTAKLNQPAKRPPRTGFDISKARERLEFDPLSIEDSLVMMFK
jgi:dTDP-4-dehydrorhamnose reductase